MPLSPPNEILDGLDEERLSVLYSPFRAKSINPQSWESKHQFWNHSILKWLKKNERVTFSFEEVSDAFQRGQNREKPFCLQEIHDKMLADKKIVAKQRWLKSCQNQSWTGYLLGSAQGAGGFLLSKVWSGKSQWSTEEFVCLELLEEVGKELHQKLIKSIGSGAPVPILKREMNCDLKEDSEIVFLHLESKGLLASREVDGEIFVKIGIKQIKFSEEECTILRLKKLSKSLNIVIDQKEEQISKLRTEIKELLKSESRVKAKYSLKKLKRVETSLEKNLSVAYNIDILLDKLESVKDDAKIKLVYETSLQALKEATGAMNIDDINRLMDEIRETIEDSDDIGNAIANSSIDGDEQSLEKELEELVKEDSPDDLIETLDKLSVHDEELKKQIPSKKVANKY